ncbi:protein MODIFIER OF SNC1 11-like [Chenopodium quinoa]|uniref:THO1-MOS11 C-terminal domain-containing protein n=1 Tax=Chenopodium quinoa TaxID=63459 RepID=A0A803NAB3_CHEQI|nr:protein MODIFIER OF SNC1 11-like [Chenopodium quinoa]
MATATQTNSPSQISDLENPNKTLILTTTNLTDKTTKSSDESAAAIDAVVNSKDSEESMEGTDSTAVVSPTGGSANDIEKKVRRAERFGVPVQLSEQEKRSSRAERFGVGAGSEASKTSEDLKRKARAERFGLSLSADEEAKKSADEEAKKKARLARFGSDTKTDTLEEEKRKARALRFSQPSSNAVQHVNGKEDVGSNPAIAGNAVEGV